MVILKSRDEIEIMRKAGAIVAEVLVRLSEMLQAGMTTMDLEKMAKDTINKLGAKPAFPMVPGYKHALCVSINEEIVHGIPGKKEIHEGDIVSIDCGVVIDGFFGDHAWSFPVGDVSDSVKNLLNTGKDALMKGIDRARENNRLYDISATIEKIAVDAGYSVVRDYVGHGIGRSLHEDPQVPNFGREGTGMKLRKGLVIALEPMLNAGTYEVDVLDDGWTVVTRDRKPSVHFEHTIAIMDNGPEILSVMH